MQNIVRHHVSYYPEKIVFLCRSCHSKEHARGNAPKRPKGFHSNIVRYDEMTGPVPICNIDIVKMHVGNRIAIPKEFRDALGWVQGMKLRVIREEEKVILELVRGAEDR